MLRGELADGCVDEGQSRYERALERSGQRTRSESLGRLADARQVDADDWGSCEESALVSAEYLGQRRRSLDAPRPSPLPISMVYERVVKDVSSSKRWVATADSAGPVSCGCDDEAKGTHRATATGPSLARRPGRQAASTAARPPLPSRRRRCASPSTRQVR